MLGAFNFRVSGRFGLEFGSTLAMTASGSFSLSLLVEKSFEIIFGILEKVLFFALNS